MNMFNAISSVLQNICAVASAGSIRAETNITFNHLISFEFVFVLCIMREILEIAEILGQVLQKKSKHSKCYPFDIIHKSVSSENERRWSEKFL